uniref:Uncharacterized protein n=1 Tax=Oryza sativa subsp. japonica TaxID=39947 RepID=Q69T48_ORYSJ|nr:hypothetical protein [Oryza sativa Japonica Group]
MVMEVDGGLGQRRPRGCHQKHPRRSPPEKENMVYLKIALSPSLRKRIEGRKGGRSGGVCQGVGMKNTWRKTKPVGPWEDIKKRNGNLSRGECDIYDA